jgi:hypothetical protein
MPLLVDVPLNTMLADLDESLRALLKRELGRHGFDGAEVSFDAPSRDWSAKLTGPTVDLFLYDLQESADHRQRQIEDRGRHAAHQVRPPLIVNCSYAVTAWTQDVQDEHRLLSQVLAILYAYPRLPSDALHERLRNGSQRYPVTGRVGQAKAEGKADFWNAVGGQYKPSLEYVVTLSCDAGAVYERGPEVRSSVVRTEMIDAAPGTSVELARAGGVVRDPDGRPVANVWVTLPELGRWASTDTDGGFALDRVPPGRHRIVARSATGAEAEGELAVPGPALELVVGATGAKRRRRARTA